MAFIQKTLVFKFILSTEVSSVLYQSSLSTSICTFTLLKQEQALTSSLVTALGAMQLQVWRYLERHLQFKLTKGSEIWDFSRFVLSKCCDWSYTFLVSSLFVFFSISHIQLSQSDKKAFWENGLRHRISAMINIRKYICFHLKVYMMRVIWVKKVNSVMFCFVIPAVQLVYMLY